LLKFIAGVGLGLLLGWLVMGPGALALLGILIAVFGLIGFNLNDPSYSSNFIILLPYLLYFVFFVYIMRKTGDRFLCGLLLGIPVPGTLLVLTMHQMSG
jgi:hypothetical protein